jgi:3-phenylpropionate/trans-cinnamate dioxygenase ferredoxin reductase component
MNNPESSQQPNNTRQSVDYLLIGGGLASATAAETLRQRDPQSTITIITNDTEFPYHRPPLSKEYLRAEIEADGIYGQGGVYVQLPEWYQFQNIEVRHNTSVTDLDTTAKVATLSDGQTIHYGMALLATGGRPRRLSVPGADLLGVYALRTLADAHSLREKVVAGQHVVIVGSGFIGLEVAASFLVKGARVTIVDPLPRVWPNIVSAPISQFIQDQFVFHGATLRYGWNVTGFEAGSSGHVEAVRLSSVEDRSAEEIIRCDLVVIGVGIELNTSLAQSAGLEIDPKHGIVVNEKLETRSAAVFAAGDVAAFPNLRGSRMHFEHWDNAIATGEVAAANMSGDDVVFRHVPYFFSDQFDLSFNMLGVPSSEAEIILRGDMAAKQFTAFYIQDSMLQAALMINDDAQMDLLRQLIAESVTIDNPQDLGDSQFDLVRLQSNQGK